MTHSRSSLDLAQGNEIPVTSAAIIPFMLSESSMDKNLLDIRLQI
jgi:hypothetical protein